MIHTGDCVDWLRAMPDKSADHCITDPPYSEHVHAKSMRSMGNTKVRAHDKFRRPGKRDLGFSSMTPELMELVACELARVVKRWVLVFSATELAPAWWWALQGAGLEYIRTCPWIKPDGAPQFSGDRPGCGWESIVVAHPKGVKKWNGGGHKGVFTHCLERTNDHVHTTAKPISLMLELVDLFTDAGDTVIDPFAGSASTGVACLRLGRDFHGAELDPAMADLATQRLAAEGSHTTLGAMLGGQVPLFGGARG